MPNIKDIKDRIGSVEEIRKITRAMKLVSVAKMQKAQARVEASSPYIDAMRGLVARTVQPGDTHPLLEEGGGSAVCLVIVTSDKGLCGNFNSQVIRQAIRSIEAESSPVRLACVGRKGRRFFTRGQYEVVESPEEVFGDVTFQRAEGVADVLMAQFRDGGCREVRVLANNFRTTILREVTERVVLPLRGITGSEEGPSYLFEPSRGGVLGPLLFDYFRWQVFGMLLESEAAEHVARMQAMDAATSNAEDLMDRLRLQYNRARQQSITTEIMDIVGGAEALR